jgi:hypothetical protein
MIPGPVPGLLEAGDRSRLAAVLVRAKELGFVGRGPVEDQIDRSLGLLPIIHTTGLSVDSSVEALDLGSGGGLPGLVLALTLTAWRWILLDGSVKRTTWLREAVDTLGLNDRVSVLTARAEVAGRGPLRGTVDLVVSRGFAAPAPTAECAAPLLKTGGWLVVTEPPGGSPDRWPPDGLASLGLSREQLVTSPIAAVLIRSATATDGRYPRRVGVPVKRPLWTTAHAQVPRET